VKRSNEVAVGITVVVALIAVVIGAILLGQIRIGQRDEIRTARFRSVGGLGKGAFVTLRGVRVGRVAEVRIAPQDWVEVDFQLQPGLELPVRPAAIAAPATLFGEWRVNIIAIEEASTDRRVQFALADAMAAGPTAWPGTTLPDIGEITQQASRIAGDIGVLTERIEGALDSGAVEDVKRSLRDLRATVVRLTRFADTESGNIERLTGSLTRTSGTVDQVAGRLNTVFGRIDSATADGQLVELMNQTRATGTELRELTRDMRTIITDVKNRRGTLISVLETTDTLLTRVRNGRGTLSLLASDSVLYQEATRTVAQLRTLLADIQANPRRYFRFSVF
jgi:phospholipid/cholesterol/gamma-HCH transport system substrate-binding protein